MGKPTPIRGLDPEESIFINSALTIETRLGDLFSYEPYLDDPEKVYELHQMRIAAKRLRYTLEIFQPVYAQFSDFRIQYDSAIRSVKSLQEQLGEIHDADVLIPQLSGHLLTLLKPGYEKTKHNVEPVGAHLVDFDSCQGVLTICKEIRDRRDRYYEQLRNDWRKLKEENLFENLLTLLKINAEQSAASNKEIESIPSLQNGDVDESGTESIRVSETYERRETEGSIADSVESAPRRKRAARRSGAAGSSSNASRNTTARTDKGPRTPEGGSE